MKKPKIAMLTFSLLAMFLLLAQARDSNGATAGVHEIPIKAKKYEFTPRSIHVKKGEHVKLLIAASIMTTDSSCLRSTSTKTLRKARLPRLSSPPTKRVLSSSLVPMFAGLVTGG